MDTRALHTAIIATLVLAAAAVPAAAQDKKDEEEIPPPPPSWPVLRADNQRSGFSHQNLGRTLERDWYRDFTVERLAPRAEAIVVDGKCFVPTLAGNVYALNTRNGRTEWSYHAPGRIGHSVAFQRIGPDWRKREGRILLVTDDAWNRGHIICLNARSGREIWRYEAGAGFWTAPLCDGSRVYAGDRAGVLHAVSLETGQPAWTYETGGMILQPPSMTGNERLVIVGAEDMRVYAVEADTGKEAWVSEKLPGLSLRDYPPVICRDRVIVRTNPARAFHETLEEHRDLLVDTQRSAPREKGDAVMLMTQHQYVLRRTNRREKLENQAIAAWLGEHPADQTFHVLNVKDGKRPFVAPVLYTGGMGNPPSPPVFRPGRREVYTILPTALSAYASGVSQLTIGIGEMDTKSGYIKNVEHRMGEKLPGYFAGMTMLAEETSTLSLMDNFLAVTHQGAIGGVDLKRRQARLLHGVRDTYGGLFGPGLVEGGRAGSLQLVRQGYVQNAVNEWHGPARGSASVAEGRVFWVVGGTVICLHRRDRRVEEKDDGIPWKWPDMPRIDGGNITAPLGEYNADAEPPVITADEAAFFLLPPRGGQPRNNDQADAVRDRLVRAVNELIDGHPWQPLLVVLGMSGTQQYFWRTSETMEAVAAALPHLPNETRVKAVAFLDELWQNGVPLRTPIYGRAGNRREPYDLHPDALTSPAARPVVAYTARASDLYAVWAYAHYANRWKQVADAVPAVKAAFTRSFGRPFAFNPAEPGPHEPEFLNGMIAGAIAYARIMKRVDEDLAAKQATDLLARMLVNRIQLERANPHLQSPREHLAGTYRYNRMTPELAAALAEHAGQQLGRNLADLDRELPGWYHAWPTRWIGGENYTTPPTVAEGIFVTAAEALDPKADQLLQRLDQPWCKADIFYIRKLTAVLRGLDNARLRDTRRNLPDRPEPARETNQR